eukprot:TRINITY_DN37208_c0_g1_i1.p1 TRINITY_DN37208_c0_g1~~TRINITY_DN37208_c0_g1_i1.p1  ORF type:complete len:119 (+),score=49.54 TRINITY_DN37208_c0_g1_i1:53-358(+)
MGTSLPHIKTGTNLSMSSKVSSSSSWSWDSLPSFQTLTAAISNPRGMSEVEKVFADMQERLTKLQVSADLDSTLVLMKTNMEKLLELFRDASDTMKEATTN